MIVNVKTRAGATFQFASRKDMRRTLDKPNQPPLEGDSFVRAWIKDAPEWAWRPVRVLNLRRYGVEFVIAAEDVALSDDDLPAKEMAEERKAEYDRREEAARERAEHPVEPPPPGPPAPPQPPDDRPVG